MRYFWSLILVLVLTTLGLFATRWTQSRPEAAAPTGASDPAQTFARPAARPPDSRSDSSVSPMDSVASDPTPVAQTPAVAAVTEPFAAPAELARTVPDPAAPESDRVVEAVAEAASTPTNEVTSPELAPDPNPSPVPATEVATASKPAEQDSDFSLDALLGVVADAAERATPPQTATETPQASDPMLAAAAAAVESSDQAKNAPSGITDETTTTTAAAPVAAEPVPGPVGPSFEVRADGSIAVEGVGVVPGAGTPQRPFVLDWDVLRSLAREFNPRQGQSEVPGWVMQLHGKRVRVEGNTLLPVVAQTTNELLVMQNPWDGCCLGVPPTPYDAIEVKLAKMQRMGNSPTGYGQVEGVFKVDPYIVSGWLLGLYVIDEASFESGAGIALPEI